MGRYVANTAILAKIEATSGTDAAPVGATDAVLISEMSITPLDATLVQRNLIRPYFGNSEQLITTANVKASYSVELAGSGTAGTPPQWGKLLLGCACAEAQLTTPARVEYTPVNTALKTLTQYWHDDGVLHKLLGAMGNAKISAKVGTIPKLKFDWIGVDGGISTVANPAVVLTAWKTPPVMNKVSTVDITLGATYAAGVLTGGTVYPSTGLECDLGNKTSFFALLSQERVEITDRDSTGSMVLELTAAQEVTFMATVKANTTQSLALTIGTVAGNKVMLFFPAVQLIKPTKQDQNGVRLVGYELVPVPVVGNDDFRIICL